MFYLELTTGIRRGELVALLWDDLDLEAQTLTINKSAGRINGDVKVTQPKTANSVRTIFLPQETINLLIQEHSKHPTNPIMFPSPITGKLYGPDCIGRLHKKLLKKAGITENIPFHGLRHPNVKPKTQIFLHKINLHFAALVIFYCPQYYVVLRYDRALLIDAIFLQIEIALMYRLL